MNAYAPGKLSARVTDIFVADTLKAWTFTAEMLCVLALFVAKTLQPMHPAKKGAQRSEFQPVVLAAVAS